MVISVRWHRGERTLAACIRHCHTDPLPGMMVWGVLMATRLERLARHHTPVTTVDKVGYGVETAWLSVSVHALQSLFDSILKRISAVISARGGCFWY
ncbi:uncharacterized protein TNCV_3186201 [Trichonephila clavipes]|nr:uncharacterized protein TNCV_3186201 [Trichonephila clavipes]